jgi:hypothetical protein
MTSGGGGGGGRAAAPSRLFGSSRVPSIVPAYLEHACVRTLPCGPLHTTITEGGGVITLKRAPPRPPPRLPHARAPQAPRRRPRAACCVARPRPRPPPRRLRLRAATRGSRRPCSAPPGARAPRLEHRHTPCIGVTPFTAGRQASADWPGVGHALCRGCRPQKAEPASAAPAVAACSARPHT